MESRLLSLANLFISLRTPNIKKFISFSALRFLTRSLHFYFITLLIGFLVLCATESTKLIIVIAIRLALCSRKLSESLRCIWLGHVGDGSSILPIDECGALLLDIGVVEVSFETGIVEVLQAIVNGWLLLDVWLPDWWHVVIDQQGRPHNLAVSACDAAVAIFLSSAFHTVDLLNHCDGWFASASGYVSLLVWV